MSSEISKIQKIPPPHSDSNINVDSNLDSNINRFRELGFIKTNDKKHKHFSSTFYRLHILTNNGLPKFTEDSDGRLFFKLASGQIMILNPTTGINEKYVNEIVKDFNKFSDSSVGAGSQKSQKDPSKIVSITYPKLSKTANPDTLSQITNKVASDDDEVASD